jgi:hypothetical protein
MVWPRLRLAKQLPRREWNCKIFIFQQLTSTSDAANFINFCTGKTLTNGLQVKGGSCNGIGKSRTVFYKHYILIRDSYG